MNTPRGRDRGAVGEFASYASVLPEAAGCQAVMARFPAGRGRRHGLDAASRSEVPGLCKIIHPRQPSPNRGTVAGRMPTKVLGFTPPGVVVIVCGPVRMLIPGQPRVP